MKADLKAGFHLKYKEKSLRDSKRYMFGKGHSGCYVKNGWKGVKNVPWLNQRC